MQIYKEFITAKNGSQIPVFTSGRTMESRYNPERDAENLCNSINEEAGFFLVLGIGSGIFIKLLSQKYPESKILALELYKEDIDFLLQNESLNQLSKNSSISICCLEELETFLTQNYFPAKYGSFKIIEQRSWVNENQAHIENINFILNKTFGIISADFSVQAHFGKIWNTNIINNSKLAEKLNSQELYKSIKDNNHKTAIIAGAGPSLDKTSELLKTNRDSYFIIATDTAGKALIKQNIIPDVIVSIDAQSVSYNHFINKDISSKILYAFDLCGNSSAVRHLFSQGNNIFFFCSGHPLSTAINAGSGFSLPVFFSGAGTVTITALDIAVQAGFTDIMILGADFSYSDGKAYTSGTYLDTLYNKGSSKLAETEQTFSKLMFRTELLELTRNKKTTQILQAYKGSLENYLTEKNISFTKNADIYKLHCPSHPKLSATSPSAPKALLKPFFDRLQNAKPEEAETILLPYVAWLRNNERYKNFTYKELLKLALDTIVSYNI